MAFKISSFNLFLSSFELLALTRVGRLFLLSSLLGDCFSSEVAKVTDFEDGLGLVLMSSSVCAFSVFNLNGENLAISYLKVPLPPTSFFFGFSSGFYLTSLPRFALQLWFAQDSKV